MRALAAVLAFLLAAPAWGGMVMRGSGGGGTPNCSTDIGLNDGVTGVSTASTTEALGSEVTYSGTTCIANTLCVWTRSSDSGDTITLGVYSDNAGNPNTLLAQIATPITIGGVNQWQCAAMATPMTFTNGAVYHLTTLTSASYTYTYIASGNLARQTMTYPTLNDPFGTPIATLTRTQAVYAKYQ